MSLGTCTIAVLNAIIGIPRLKEVFKTALLSAKVALQAQLVMLKLQVGRMRVVSTLYQTISASIDAAITKTAANFTLSFRPEIKLLIEDCPEFSNALNVIDVTFTNKGIINKKFSDDRRLQSIRRFEDKILQIENTIKFIDDVIALIQ